MMNSVVEKLAAIEKEVAVIQPKMAPLTERIADLDRKVTNFAQQLTGIADESAAVKQDIELTQQGLTRIQTLISESRAESEQLVAGQEESLQRCETMQAVFGAAFQAVSQFFEAAQRIGLADQAKAVFLNPPIETADDRQPTEEPKQQPVAIAMETEETADGEQQTEDDQPVPQSEECEFAPPDELPAWEPPTMESVLAESVLTESDFAPPVSDTDENEKELASWSIPNLPDVAAPPEIVDQTELDSADSDAGTDSEPSYDMASQLDVPPLNLSVPPLPEQGEEEAKDNADEIEALLESMGAPVTASAGH